MTKQTPGLNERIYELIQKEEPISQQILIKTIELVSQKNLSVEALSKKVDREVDRIISTMEQGDKTV